MNKIKKELLKALLSMHGQKKICDCLNNIDQAFDILLREQKEEFKRVVKRIQILTDEIY